MVRKKEKGGNKEREREERRNYESIGKKILERNAEVKIELNDK